jgi:hypothetical protein
MSKSLPHPPPKGGGLLNGKQEVKNTKKNKLFFGFLLA